MPFIYSATSRSTGRCGSTPDGGDARGGHHGVVCRAPLFHRLHGGGSVPPRFFGYLSMFTFAMLMLVTADNLVQLFFGWEGRRLASYLLIGFWYHKPEANAAAIKASSSIASATSASRSHLCGVHDDRGGRFRHHLPPGAGAGRQDHSLLQVGRRRPHLICVLLSWAPMGKSAQFLLHTWLPDAMEGPTPVSALIHAATMVTAGVFMVAGCRRCSSCQPDAQTFRHRDRRHHGDVRRHGRAGAERHQAHRRLFDLLAARLHVRRHGVGAYSVGMYHLFTLRSQGPSVPRFGLGDRGDASRAGHPQHGWAADKNPFTYITMVVGTLALTGFPMFAGYFSKDAIIEAAMRARIRRRCTAS